MKIKKTWFEGEGFANFKTGAVFVFALLIAVVSNGFIEGFAVEQLITFAVGLGTMGIYGAVQSLTKEGAARGNDDATEDDEELRALKNDIREKAGKVKREKANTIIHTWNKKNLAIARKSRYDDLTVEYEQMIVVYTNRIDLITSTLRSHHLLRKLLRLHFSRKVLKVKKKQAKLTPQNVYVKFDFIELDDILALDNIRNENLTEKQKLKENPTARTVRSMRITNFAKTLFFFGLQGAIYASLFGRSGLLWFVLTITATLVSTLLVAYFVTYKYARGDYKNTLHKKNDYLTRIIAEQDTAQIFVWEFQPNGDRVKRYI